jgi:hypothetical protein
MLADAAGTSQPVVAALLGLGAAGLAGAVVAMAWSVHSRQIRLAELLVRRQFILTRERPVPADALNGYTPLEADQLQETLEAVGTREAHPGQRTQGSPGGHPGHGSHSAGPQGNGGHPGHASQAGHGGQPADGGRPANGSQPGDGGQPGNASGQPGNGNHQARGANAGRPGKLGIEGPDTITVGEQVCFRVRPTAVGTSVTWAVGGGSVSQAPDPTHPDELLLIADRPGSMTLHVRVREGLTERRETMAITAVPEVAAPAPPFPLRLFLHNWGLVVVAIVVVGFAGALDALGNLTSADFIALVVPLTALLGVLAAVRGSNEPGLPHRSPGHSPPPPEH